ncbi:MAG: DUF4350 domain-containing protein [Maribacter sp.]
MQRRSKIILGLLVAVLVGIVVTELVRPKPINWRPSYTSDSKIPFGCYVLFNELQTIFPNSNIESVEESVYDLLIDRDSSIPSSYMIIDDFVSLDKQETNQLLNYVAQGNQVFIATSDLGGVLADTLNITIDRRYDFSEDTVSVELTNKRYKGALFQYERGVYPAYFSSVDTANTQILGYINFAEKKFVQEDKAVNKRAPNFIKTEFGKGIFLLNALPVAYTNYYLLSDSNPYVAHTFSYLKDEFLYWDDYKKSGRTIITSPMRFVLNQPALKWGYYLSIIGILLFVVFKAKREQRIIPVLEPLQNSSVAFARTVGALYHQNKDYTNLNGKNINFFLSGIRRTYYLETTTLDERFIAQLSAKSGKSIQETKTLIELILHLKNKPMHTEQDTIILSKNINTFK